jgi:hypothetical protein
VRCKPYPYGLPFPPKSPASDNILLGCKKDKDVIKALRKFGADNKEYYDSPQLEKRKSI